ncbi:hypothetical protein niasHT_006135 [Heterodera trifolii]|uniref:Uncharacterized protein n=1 Tax=Heterodera trifolii TaxID=157864 RepID=A0ABD2M346_9BILA
MYANFPITCRAASSSSFSAHRRHRLLLSIVLLVVLSMATEFANGMGCVSSKDQASSSPSSPARHSNAGAGGGRLRAVSNLPDVEQTDNVWHVCWDYCGKYNNKPDMCASTGNVMHMEGKQCRCKMPRHDRRQCLPYLFQNQTGKI